MKAVLLLLLSLAIAPFAWGQDASKVLKQGEKSLGGTKALQSVRSITATGVIKRVSDGAEGKYLYQSAAPNLLNISYDIAGFETEYGYNGRSGWVRNSRDGMQTLVGKPSVEMQAAALYRNNRWLRYKDEKARITSSGQSQVDGKPANSLTFNTPKGSLLRLHFDKVTGLPVRDEITLGGQPMVFEYSEYRLISGIKHPHFMRMISGGETYEIRLNDVRINGPVQTSEFDFPKVSTEPLPDIKDLLREVQANEDAVEEMLDNYSYKQKSVKRELGEDGVLREVGSETQQLSFYKGRRIRRLIEKNGKPLSADDQADEDKDAADRVREIEKEVAKQEQKMLKQSKVGTPSEDSRRVSIAEVLRASRLINPRRERFQGRDVIVFDFEPNPAFDMSNAKSMLKFFGKTAGVMWIDEKDKQVARLEAVLYESYKVGGGVLAKLQKGASFMLEKERFNNEIWLPSVAEINLSVKVLLVKGINVNQVVRSYDYSRFNTEVKDSSVGEPSKPTDQR